MRPSSAIGDGMTFARSSTAVRSAAGNDPATFSSDSVGFSVIGSDTEVTAGSFSIAATESAIERAAAGSVTLWPAGTENTTVAVAPFCELKRSSSMS